MGWMKDTVITAALPAMPTCWSRPGAAAAEVAMGCCLFVRLIVCVDTESKRMNVGENVESFSVGTTSRGGGFLRWWTDVGEKVRLLFASLWHVVLTCRRDDCEEMRNPPRARPSLLIRNRNLAGAGCHKGKPAFQTGAAY